MAKKEIFDDSDGVWRTIGGRRVFIKEGQSLSDAMKESGKFSRVARNQGLYKKVEEENKNDKKANKDDINSESKFMEKRRKEIALEREKGVYDGSRPTDEKGNYKYQKELDEKEKTLQNNKSDSEVDLIDVGDGKYLTIRKGESKEDVLKAYEEREKKYREHLEPEVSKNLRDPRRLWDRDLVDTYIEMNERGLFTGKDKDKFTRDMKDMEGKPLYRPGIANDDNKSIKQLNNEMLGDRYKGKGETPSQIYSNDRRIDIATNENGGKTATVWKDGKIERKTNLPENVSGDKTKDYFDKYLKELDNSSNQINNTLRQKAYQKYLKEHPNSKMTFNEFKDMNK